MVEIVCLSDAGCSVIRLTRCWKLFTHISIRPGRWTVKRDHLKEKGTSLERTHQPCQSGVTRLTLSKYVVLIQHLISANCINTKSKSTPNPPKLTQNYFFKSHLKKKKSHAYTIIRLCREETVQMLCKHSLLQKPSSSPASSERDTSTFTPLTHDAFGHEYLPYYMVYLQSNHPTYNFKCSKNFIYFKGIMWGKMNQCYFFI